MPRHTDPRRRCLPLDEWPAGDRTLWVAALAASAGRFSTRGYAATLRPASLDKVREGYGRWLGFLAQEGWLDHDSSPADRVTPERLDAYFAVLQTLGNADHTISGRFQELATALRVLAPGRDHGWVSCPGGRSLRSRLPMRKRPLTLHSAHDLHRWGLDLMEAALHLAGPRRRQVQLRDGLLIALLAARGLRLRSVLSLRLGHNLHRDPMTGTWRIALAPEDVKNRRAIAYDLPHTLIPWLDRYLAVERAELLAGATADHLWINWGGERLEEKGLDKRIRWHSARRFGAREAFGSHRFRHCIASTAPLLAPELPGLAATTLGITGDIVEKHYDRAANTIAARGYLQAVASQRRAGAEQAARAFAALRAAALP